MNNTECWTFANLMFDIHFRHMVGWEWVIHGAMISMTLPESFLDRLTKNMDKTTLLNEKHDGEIVWPGGVAVNVQSEVVYLCGLLSASVL